MMQRKSLPEIPTHLLAVLTCSTMLIRSQNLQIAASAFLIPTDVIPQALVYLGYDDSSKDPDELRKQRISYMRLDHILKNSLQALY